MAAFIFAHLQRLAAALSRISGETTTANELIAPTIASGAHVLWELSQSSPADLPAQLEALPGGRPPRFKVAVAPRDDLVERACQLEPDAIQVHCMSPGGQSARSGAELTAQFVRAASAVSIAKRHGIKVGLCIPAAREEVETAHLLGAAQVSLHAADYAQQRAERQDAQAALSRLKQAAVRAHELGLELAVGHGLTLQCIGAAARIGVVAEMHLGEAFARDAHQLGLSVALAQAHSAVDPSAGGP